MAMFSCQLWMGSLETYMSENFIMAAFRKMGEDPISVKLMRNKFTGEPAGYCFVSFGTDDQAVDAMHKLNGKPIPGTNPVIRFRLNNATNSQTKTLLADREFSVWVGDLSSDVDDYNLYRIFSTKYTSIRTAKVILDGTGFSKGYGFVKFGLEDEQKSALYEMNGYIGLGSKPLKICSAVPKPKGPNGEPVFSTSATAAVNSVYGAAAADYSQYYDPSTYWQQTYGAWQGYYDQSNQTGEQNYYQQAPVTGNGYSAHLYEQPTEDDELALVDHKFILDVDKCNREMIDRDRNLWDALESSKWLPIEQLEIY